MLLQCFMAIEDLVLGMIAGACGSLVLWVTIGKRMMLKYAGVSVARAIANPDPEMEAALNGLVTYLWNWLNSPSIEVDGPLTEDGGKTKVKVTPMQSVMGTMIETIVSRIWARFSGAKGAAGRDANRMAESALGSIPLGPRKGQSTGEYLMEQLSMRLMPKVEEAINKRLENREPGQGGML